MLKKSFIPILFFVFYLGACGDTNENSQNNGEEINTNPIRYETEQEQKDRLNVREPSIGEQGGYPQSEQRGVNTADYEEYSDVFTNEESIKISEELRKQKDIIQAQVASTDDRIFVAVMLREQVDQTIANDIEEDVRNIVPETDKQIIVYTDDVQWDRMKNLDSRLKAKDVGEDIQKNLNDFFNLDD